MNPILKKFLVLVTVIAGVINPAFSEDPQIWDPIEPVNRGIFWFNDKFDVYLLEPVARKYDKYMPDEVKVKVSNFFDNLLSIRNIPNALVQFKFKQTFRETGRFLTNSTLGLAGLFDVASEFGLEEQTGEDFGVTMAYYGMPSGPYIVLPFLGPSNLRDAVGKGVDFFTSPPYILQHVGLSQGQENSIIYSYIGVDAIQTRYSLLDAIEAGKEASIDYYLFAQSAYYQNREGKLYDGNPPSKALSEDELLNDDDF